jgi:hypothetical protein
MADEIEAAFPKLQGTNWSKTSESEDCYNCIAWAAEVVTQWWWPTDPGKTYWPEALPRSVTLAAFQAAFATLGYVVCTNADPEPGFQMVALFARSDGIPTHAARQLSNGRWTSKLGMMQDIEHELRDLEGAVYGAVALVMKRARSE